MLLPDILILYILSKVHIALHYTHNLTDKARFNWKIRNATLTLMDIVRARLDHKVAISTESMLIM